MANGVINYSDDRINELLSNVDKYETTSLPALKNSIEEVNDNIDKINSDITTINNNKVTDATAIIEEEDKAIKYPTVQYLESKEKSLNEEISILRDSISTISLVYIVESGTKNGWEYKKWSDGTCECLYSGTQTITAYKGDLGSPLNRQEVRINYPFSIKEPRPFINAYPDASVGFGLGLNWDNYQQYVTVELIVVGNQTVPKIWYISIFVKGKWREGGND